MTRLSLILALCLSLTAEAAKPQSSAIENTSIDEAEYATLFADIEGRLSSDPAGVAGQLMVIIEDSAQSNAHGAAYGLLAEAFQNMGLPYSAAVLYNQGFMSDMGINTKRISKMPLNKLKSGTIRSARQMLSITVIFAQAPLVKPWLTRQPNTLSKHGFALANAMISIVPAEAAQYGRSRLKALFSPIKAMRRGRLFRF